ncbi:hypothetical protein HMPREF1318_0916 [Actinomyces massiliensis F0489]|uniref:Uncharacterized protein n=1 Tax=Actinomyces massiliensis F0489 TaxID=1125718 RepID=J0NKS2_9ACTO|nr:hypothetical protein HMPREF1318_0916 [Actinomyces massiliensis F0489]
MGLGVDHQTRRHKRAPSGYHEGGGSPAPPGTRADPHDSP